MPDEAIRQRVQMGPAPDVAQPRGKNDVSRLERITEPVLLSEAPCSSGPMVGNSRLC